MPFYPRNKSRSQGRRRRRRKKSRGKARVPRLKLGFPTVNTVKLRYCEALNINATPANLNYHLYRMNNVYDPDQTGMGHQPRCFDLWASVYDRYSVLGAKITVSVLGPTTSTVGQKIGIIMTGNSTTMAYPNNDLAALQEMPSLKAKIRTVHAEPSRTKPISHTWSYKRTQGRLNPTDDVLSGTTAGAAPAHEEYAAVFVGAAGINESSDPQQLNCLVQIDYIVRFYQPKRDYPES